MFKLMKAVLPAFLMCAYLAPAAAEPIGNSFTYQGRLNVSGSPAATAQDFEFALYDAATAGAQVGTTNAFPAVSITYGLFSVPLDFGAGAFGTAARYLEVRVKPAGSAVAYTTLSPRQPITPAPVALTVPDGSLTRSKITDDFNPLYAAHGTSGQILGSQDNIFFNQSTQAKGFYRNSSGCTALHTGLYAVSVQLTPELFTPETYTRTVQLRVNGTVRETLGVMVMNGGATFNGTCWVNLNAGNNVEIWTTSGYGNLFYIAGSPNGPKLKIVRVD